MNKGAAWGSINRCVLLEGELPDGVSATAFCIIFLNSEGSAELFVPGPMSGGTSGVPPGPITFIPLPRYHGTQMESPVHLW